MRPEEIIAAIDQFLHLLQEGTGDEDTDICALSRCLDELALAYHDSESDLDCEEDAVAEDYTRVRRLAAERFPHLGFYYKTARSVDLNTEPDMRMGDALDDIADIALDLYEVLWYWNHQCHKTSLWQFHWGYENHWGEHLRSLQNHLYTVQHRA